METQPGDRRFTLKPLTVRFPDDVLQALDVIARVEGTTVSDLVRDGVSRVLKTKSGKRDLLARAKQHARDEQRILQTVMKNAVVNQNGRNGHKKS